MHQSDFWIKTVKNMRPRFAIVFTPDFTGVILKSGHTHVTPFQCDSLLYNYIGNGGDRGRETR